LSQLLLPKLDNISVCLYLTCEIYFQIGAIDDPIVDDVPTKSEGFDAMLPEEIKREVKHEDEDSFSTLSSTIIVKEEWIGGTEEDQAEGVEVNIKDLLWYIQPEWNTTHTR